MAGHSKASGLGQRLHDHIEAVATELYGEPTHVNGTQLRYRGKGALAVDTEEQFFYDHESGVGGGVFQLILNAHDGDNGAAIEWAQNFLNESLEPPKPRDRTDHQDEDWKRNLALEIVEKQQAAEGTSAEAYLASRGIDDPELVTQVGYFPAIRGDDDALAAVATDEDDNPVAVQLTFITCDGEKSAREPVRLTYKIDSHWSAKGGVRIAGEGALILCEGVEDAMSCRLATGRPTVAVLGASNLGRYVPDGERGVTICPDGDDPDSAAAKRVVRACDDLLLAGIKEVLVAPLKYDDENERKVDANDVLRDHGVKALHEIIEAAEPAQLSYEGEIRRLAVMDINECAVQIKPAHEALKERSIEVLLSDFRDAVRKARTEVEAEPQCSTRITSMAPASPTLMESGDLLRRIVGTIQKYIVIDGDLALLVGLYVMFTHVFENFDCCPRLMITAPTRAAGKTLLASVIGKLCAWPLSTSNASVAALFRVIESETPTLLIGEFDTFMKQSEDHRNIVNSGHYREEAFVLRTVGEEFEPKRFSTFAPMVLSGIGTLHRTIMSRSIVIPMRRRLENEKIARFDRKAREKLSSDQGLIVRWALDFDEKSASLPIPAPVPELDDRANDNAEPLLLIAQDCGEECETLCRAALVKAYKAANQPGDDELNILALEDLRGAFLENDQAFIGGVVFTDEVIGHMGTMTDRPWSEMPKTGKLITPHKLGWLLRGFVLKGDRVSRDGDRNRGFRWELCEDAFARYLPRLSEADDKVSNAGPLSSRSQSDQASAAQENKASKSGHFGGHFDEDVPAVIPPAPSSTDGLGPDDEAL